MGKFKKIIALLVGMVMALSTIPQTVFGTEFDGIPEYTTEHEMYLYGWGKADSLTQNGNTVFSCVTNEIAHSGNNSVVLRHEDTSQYGRDLKIKQGNLSLGEGTYTLSFWAAGTVARPVDDAWRHQQIVWMPNVGEGWFYVQGMNIGEKDGNWTKYSKNFVVGSGKTVTEMSISIRGWATGLYLDDISLVAQGTTENLLTNGSFEEKPYIPEYTAEHEACLYGWEKADSLTQNGNTVFSCVTNEIAHSGNNSVVLRHEDTSQYGRDLKIKQGNLNLGEGTYTLSFWAAGTVARPVDDAWRYQQIVWMPNVGEGWFYVQGMNIGEKDGNWTKYSKNFVVGSGKTVTEMSISIRGWATALYLDDISLVAQGTTENLLTNGSFEEKLYIPEYTTLYETCLYGWEKADGLTQNGGSVFSCVTDEIAHSGNNSMVLRHKDESQYGSDLKIKQGNLKLGEGTYTLSFWATGTAARPVDDDWRYQQIVWMPNMGEGWFYIQGMNIVEKDGNWTKYSMDFDVESGKTVTEMSISVRGWTNGLYLDDVSLVAQETTENLLTNGSFEERDPDEPVGDVVKEVVLEKSGKRIENLDGQGDYSVMLIVDNYAIDTVLNVEQFVAIYDEDGVLYDKVYSTAASIEKAAANGLFTKIETDFTLPEGNFTVEYFVFDGRDTLNIIGSPNPHRIFE